MASSSRSHQNLNIFNIPEEHNFFEEEKLSKVGQEKEEEEEWLKLGLGLLGSDTLCRKIEVHGSNPVLDFISPSSPLQAQIRLGLGFERGTSGLGPKDDDEGLGGGGGGGGVMKPNRDFHNCNNLLGWSSDHNYHHNDENGMVLWPAWQIDSHQDLAMPVPSDSHHYQPGLWFTLRSSTNRNGEALPQIPKAYIRVKDENMTVLMVKKYLVRKLGLSNEAEIDISCMGQRLSHIQTLKQVRDAVWQPRLVESVNSTSQSLGDSPGMSVNHIMTLLYRKHCILNCDL